MGSGCTFGDERVKAAPADAHNITDSTDALRRTNRNYLYETVLC